MDVCKYKNEFDQSDCKFVKVSECSISLKFDHLRLLDEFNELGVDH